MGFHIVQQDITKMKVDAIVNAANEGLLQGGGVCGAIFHAAGAKELTDACAQIGGCPTGQAVATDSFKLDAKYIIHTVGPVWNGGNYMERELLESCYEKSLKLALELGCESIAFPLISSGIYRYPKREALNVATKAIQTFLEAHEMEVYLTIFDREVVEISESLYEAIENYLIENEQFEFPRTLQEERFLVTGARLSPSFEIDEFEMLELDETFQQKLFRFIDERQLADPEVYKRANMSRKHFSKIRSSKDYQPTKKTVVALAIALQLSIDETDELLEAASFALSNSKRFDLIVRYFIEKNQYDLFTINEVLFKFEEPLLGQI